MEGLNGLNATDSDMRLQLLNRHSYKYYKYSQPSKNIEIIDETTSD